MINEALVHYHFYNPNAELIRHNENITYKIIDDEKIYVLRIHKPSEGFNLDMLCSNKNRSDLIADEVKLLNYLAVNGNMQTQQVKLNIYGKPVTMLSDDTPVTVLEWIDGITLENIIITSDIAYKLGRMIGRLHNNLSQRRFMNRYHYDRALLARMVDIASKVVISNHYSEIIIKTLSHIKSYLSDSSSSFILVHADLGKSNLVYNNGNIIPIDFSLSGYCIPEMDLASAFTHINDDALNKEVIDGYKSVYMLEPKKAGIEICFCLQILLFIIGQYNRFASETWFQDKLNDWCEKYFTPLIT